MIDVKLLREEPERLRASIARKKFACDLDSVLELDEKRRQAITAWEAARSQQKAANQKMAALEKGSPAFQEAVAEMKAKSAEVKQLEAEARAVDERFQAALFTVPNLPDPGIPDGGRDEDHVVIHHWGEPDQLSGKVPHWEIPWFAKLIDFERGAKVTGAGFPFYVGPMARLVRALVQYFLDEAGRAGFEELLAPLLVNETSAMATGQLPDKEGQMYADLNEGLYLIPTAEVPVTNFIRDEILDGRDLPLRRCGYTPCFRREAGSWGAHVRGLNRLHQFDKVEIVEWTRPEQSGAELEAMRRHAEGLLEQLGLPYRSLLMAAGDIGFPHYRQYDLEVWAAGQQRWLEVSSCSNFTDFQARRAGIRFKNGEGKPEYVHTLNGSALAIPRVLAALLENCFDPSSGKVLVPEVLRPHCGFDELGV